MSYKEAVQAASKQAIAKGYEAKRAEWLLLDLLDWSLTDYVMHMQDEMTTQHEQLYQQAVERMLTGEPIQYITGFQSFLGEKFQVDERCLIPRPETEEVLMYFLERLPKQSVVADVGTGSGILAVSLKRMESSLTVYASDLYEGPLEVAKTNAQRHQTNLTFLQGSDLDPYLEQGIRLDGLISNPPYIDESESVLMTDTVLEHEPHQALFADEQGLAIYRAMVEKLPYVLNDQALVVFEIGYQQGAALKEMIETMYPKVQVDVVADINQNDRIVAFKWLA